MNAPLSQSPALVAALDHARRGWRVFPCDPGSKAPLCEHGFKAATIDEGTLLAWWTRYPNAMIGTPTGPIAGVWVLDADLDPEKGKQGPSVIAGWEEHHGALPHTIQARTPRGGLHTYFKWAEGVPTNEGSLAPAIDLRGGKSGTSAEDGGYAILPPSVRADGAAYRWENPPGLFEIVDAPGWLLDKVRASRPTPNRARLAEPPDRLRTISPGGSTYARTALERECETLASTPEGGRNGALNRASFNLHQLVGGGELDSEEVADRLRDAALQAGLDERETVRTIASGAVAGMGHPRGVPQASSRPGTRPDERPFAPRSGEGGTESDRRRPQGGALDEPTSLYPPLPPPEPYPLDALGLVLGPAARAIAEKVQAPEAIAGLSILAVAALAAQAHADVALSYGQTRPLSLFLLSIAGSGDRKTTVDNEALRAVRRREALMREDHALARTSYNKALAGWNGEQKRIERDGKLDLPARMAKLDALGPEPEAPLHPFLTVPDPTVEGLIKAWSNAQPALGMFTAEGGQLTGGHGFTPESRLKTGAALSELWDGREVRRLRAGDGVTLLFGRRLSAHIMVQPDAAAAFLADEVLRDQGLLSRFLVAAPESLIGTRFHREADPAGEVAIRRCEARLLDMLNAPLPLAEGKRNELAPRSLALSTGAHELLVAYGDRIEGRSGAGGPFGPVAAIAAKSAEQAARIAGVLTLVDSINATLVDEATIASAIALAHWHLGEALRLQGAARTDPKLKRAQRLLDWLNAKGLDRVSVRDLMQTAPAQLRTKEAAEEAVGVLEAHGWLRPLVKGRAKLWERVEAS